MSADPSAFAVFISGVSSEFGPWREVLRDRLETAGAKVHAQKENPSVVGNAEGIRQQIVTSRLIVCLIGLRSGGLIKPALLASMRAQGLAPDAAPAQLTWTQWEYHVARQHVKACKAKGEHAWLMTVFCNMDNPDLHREEIDRADADQQAHIRWIVDESDHSMETRIWNDNVRDAQRVLDLVINAAAHTGGDMFEPFQSAMWFRAKQAYRDAIEREWNAQFDRDIVAGGGDADANPTGKGFIADQTMQRLKQPCAQLERALSPQAFVTGRDSEFEASAHDAGDWLRCTRDEIVALLDDAAEPDPDFKPMRPTDGARWAPRIFLVSAGGVGKTACTHRIVRDLTKAPNGTLAIRVPAGAFGQTPGRPTEVAGVLAEAMAPHVEKVARDLAPFVPDRESMQRSSDDDRADALLRAFLRERLRRDLAGGQRIAIVVDELDHIQDSNPRFLIDAQNGASLPGCGIVVAGRPHALLAWRRNPADDRRQVDLEAWAYVELGDLEPEQSRALLGTIDVPEIGPRHRYDVLQPYLGNLIRTPRVLRYILGARFSAARLQELRTAADVYWNALRAILEQSIAPEDLPAGKDMLARLLAVLGALAYLSRVRVDEPVPHRGQHDISWRDLTKLLEETVAEQGADGALLNYDAKHDLEEDRRVLAKLATIVNNGVLESMPSSAGARILKSPIKWDNLSVRDFLAAYWLAQHGPSADTHATASLPPDLVYYSDDDNPERDAAYDLNRFLAEMPREAMHAESWVLAARAWYASAPRRPSEMLFRSWTRMHLIAARPLDDWWDVPYDVVCGQAVKARIAATQRLKWHPSHPNQEVAGARPAARKAASACIDAYRSEFERLCAQGSDAQRQCLQRFVADGWQAIAAEQSFEMGAPPEQQGMPRKTEAYWRSLLSRAAAGGPGNSPSELADECTPAHWFAGAEGKRSRSSDIEEMQQVFEDHAEALRDAPKGGPDSVTAKTLQSITAMWRTRDQTPAEATQMVASFSLHESPVTLALYSVFEPGHEARISRDLATYGADSVYPPQRPVIFISWYDAWAFCQWANWTAGAGLRFQCRLPHEPEWELACRRNADGSVVPFGQRYWWGDSFYADEDSPHPEPISTPQAHAVGRAGQTRDPIEAAPNGAGLRDMLGNVWEWCANHYDPRKLERDTRSGKKGAYSRHLPDSRPSDNAVRSLRGGLWYYVDHLSTCADRYRQMPNDGDYKKGFRVVREEIR